MMVLITYSIIMTLKFHNLYIPKEKGQIIRFCEPIGQSVKICLFIVTTFSGLERENQKGTVFLCVIFWPNAY